MKTVSRGNFSMIVELKPLNMATIVGIWLNTVLTYRNTQNEKWLIIKNEN